ncbi:SDR family oxidoreductase [Fulvivirga ligni]|uniref:SDR family oxidoreductase n=1 Tax=Fulvivirga ligni TaxID=2904246 RepID=UPI001F1BE3B5|nr:SDR family oxidoreductase [Fulvivirga ligni]UII22163.1 SDR family oxidoreductase [Fulvivirga ligni]
MNTSISVLGCGWLGLPLSKELVQKGYSVNGSTTSEGKIDIVSATGATPFLLDLSSPDLPEQFFSSDIFIVTVPPSSGNYESNMKRLVTRLEKKKFPKIIFISSSSVYPNTNQLVRENDAKAIKSSHSGVTLLEIERLFNKPEFDTTIIRFAGLYGPDRHPGRFLKRKSQLTNGGNPVNLIHLDDCIAIILKIIESNKWNEVFNACADEHPSRKEFYTKASQSLGFDIPEFTDEQGDYKIVDASHLKESLGYSFIHPDPMNDL